MHKINYSKIPILIIALFFVFSCGGGSGDSGGNTDSIPVLNIISFEMRDIDDTSKTSFKISDKHKYWLKIKNESGSEFKDDVQIIFEWYDGTIRKGALNKTLINDFSIGETIEKDIITGYSADILNNSGFDLKAGITYIVKAKIDTISNTEFSLNITLTD